MTKKQEHKNRAKTILEQASYWFLWDFGTDLKEILNHIEAGCANIIPDFAEDQKITNLVRAVESALRGLRDAVSGNNAKDCAEKGIGLGVTWIALQRELAQRGGGPNNPVTPFDFIMDEYQFGPRGPRRRKIYDVCDEGLKAFKKATGKPHGKVESYVAKFAAERTKRKIPKSD